jgi:enoyl-CoA hydratase/carnithine racemase
MVNAVVPAERVFDTAMDLARRIAANAPLAVQATKRIQRRRQTIPLDQNRRLPTGQDQTQTNH